MGEVRKMIARLLTLIIKEFKAIWKDPRSRVIVTVMPLMQLIIFANAVTMEVKILICWYWITAAVIIRVS